MKFKDHNLIFVSFDALQAAHVSCLGYERKVTPTIDSVAKHGFNFTTNTTEPTVLVGCRTGGYQSVCARQKI